MKPKELRIDNWVEYNGTICRVAAIINPEPREDERYSDKWLVTLVVDGLITVPIEELKPVPTTGELLEKLGFNYDGYVWYDMRGFSVSLKWGRCVLESGDGEYSQLPFPSHIHRVQNLYETVTEEELTNVKEEDDE